MACVSTNDDGYRDREWFLDQINQQLGKNYDQTYRSLCSSERVLMFCDFLNKRSLYEEVLNERHLRDFIENSLKMYNIGTGVVPIDLVLFKDAIDHICRVVRVISQPRGYILLVGIGNILMPRNTDRRSVLTRYRSGRWFGQILAWACVELAVRLQNVHDRTD